MRVIDLDAANGLRRFAVILEEGEEAMDRLQAFARDHAIGGAQVTAIGAFSTASLAFWDPAAQQYRDRQFDRQAEVVSLLGDIVLDEKGEPACHLHAVLGFEDMALRGGHFRSGRVRPTLEVIVTESPADLRRRFDPRRGLAVIDRREDSPS
jgi:predicted DNA-binding protein with PD1-like motif